MNNAKISCHINRYHKCGQFFFRDLKLQKQMQKFSLKWYGLSSSHDIYFHRPPRETRFHRLLGVLGQPGSLRSLSLNFSRSVSPEPHKELNWMVKLRVLKSTVWFKTSENSLLCNISLCKFHLRRKWLNLFSCSSSSYFGLYAARQIIRKLSSLQSLSFEMSTFFPWIISFELFFEEISWHQWCWTERFLSTSEKPYKLTMSISQDLWVSFFSKIILFIISIAQRSRMQDWTAWGKAWKSCLSYKI